MAASLRRCPAATCGARAESSGRRRRPPGVPGTALMAAFARMMVLRSSSVASGVACAALVAAVLVAGAPVPARAQAASGVGAWTVASGDVRVRCRMTVGGAFDAVTSSLAGALRPSAPAGASWSGELRVDLATLDTGIALRNDHLRARYLEVERGADFRQAVLSGIVLADPPPDRAGRRETRFSGTLTLHGVRRAIEGEAELRRGDGRMQVEAAFPLSLEAFDIPPPRYLGVGVRDAVEVTVTFEARGGAAPPDGAP